MMFFYSKISLDSVDPIHHHTSYLWLLFQFWYKATNQCSPFLNGTTKNSLTDTGTQHKIKISIRKNKASEIHVICVLQLGKKPIEIKLLKTE